MILENFVPISGYEDRYFISPNGDVYSVKSKRLLKPLQNEKGYLYVDLHVNYKRKVKKIHRIVAETFLINTKGYKEINHKNGIKTDNRVENLEWCTRSENLLHAYKMGLRPRYNFKKYHEFLRKQKKF